MTLNADDMEAVDRLADAELRRRLAPRYRPDWALIACRGCGRRMYDDDGGYLHRWWWDWWPW
jgi:hypothetical protein